MIRTVAVFVFCDHLACVATAFSQTNEKKGE